MVAVPLFIMGRVGDCIFHNTNVNDLKITSVSIGFVEKCCIWVIILDLFTVTAAR